MIKISVVIVSWNARSFLKECLNSLRNSAHHTLEIIVVDNGSTDGSQELVTNHFPEVLLVENRANFGFAKANNIGMKQSRGSYIALINSDVKVMEGCLDRLCEFMDEHPRVGILGPKILDPDKSIQMSCRRYPSVWNLMCSTFGLNKIFPQIGFFNGEEVTDFNYETIRKVDALSGCFLMVRREALQKVGLFDEQFFLYSEDVDWCRRFWEAGWEVMFYPEAEAIHYKGGSSANAPVEFSIEQERALFQYWKKYSNRISRIALIMTLLAHHAIRVLFNFFLLITRPSKRGFIISNLGKHLTCIKWLLTNQIQANF